MAIRIVEQAGRTDVGRQRSANEDTLVLSPPFFGVADGMGGARAGEVASALAAGVFEETGPTDQPPEAELTGILRRPIAASTSWPRATRPIAAWAPRSPRPRSTAAR